MMVVTRAGFVTRRGTRRLDAAQQAEVTDRVQGVVDGLARDRADLVAHRVYHLVSGDVWPRANDPQNGEALRRDVDALLAESLRSVHVHASIISESGAELQMD